MARLIFVQKHGYATCNERGVILSNPEEGVKECWGLTQLGHLATERCASDAVSKYHLDHRTVIITSPFCSATQTASIDNMMFAVTVPCITDPDLRQRGYGEAEGKNDTCLFNVWSDDKVDPSHTKWGVESVHAVWERMERCIKRWSAHFADDRPLLFITHDDPLQIAVAGFNDWPLNRHSDLPYAESGEIRPLKLV